MHEATPVEIASLFLDFTAWRKHTEYVKANALSQPWRRDPKLTAERRAALAAMIVDCREAGRDPRVWLFLLFAVRAWRYPPELSRAHLLSARWLDAYASRRRSLVRDAKFRERLLLAQITVAQTPAGFDPRVDLDGEAEVRKARYQLAGELDRCIEESDSWTYGWHPLSVTCQTCPAAEACQKALDKGAGYPLTRVRRGELTLREVLR